MPVDVPLPYSGGPYIVTQGYNTGPSHQSNRVWGVDFGTPHGTDVRAMMSGEIDTSKNCDTIPPSEVLIEVILF